VIEVLLYKDIKANQKRGSENGGYILSIENQIKDHYQGYKTLQEPQQDQIKMKRESTGDPCEYYIYNK